MGDAARFEQRLSEIFRDHLHVAVPTRDTDLFDSAALDSLSFVELLVQLENEFGVKVSLADLELDNFRSIARIAVFIAAATAARAGAGTQEPPERPDHGRSARHG
ncbi:MAG: acyl carrier protein [Sulfurifustis sp.]